VNELVFWVKLKP